METVFFKGQPCHTCGSVPSIGETAPCFHLAGADLSQLLCTDFAGKRVVLNIFPSLVFHYKIFIVRNLVVKGV